jgi:L-alanine-DL-glutamate epimerase-like enolase superfamily enzyme
LPIFPNLNSVDMFEFGIAIFSTAGSPSGVRKGMLKVPAGPGLGIEINPDFLRKNILEGEEYRG